MMNKKLLIIAILITAFLALSVNTAFSKPFSLLQAEAKENAKAFGRNRAPQASRPEEPKDDLSFEEYSEENIYKETKVSPNDGQAYDKFGGSVSLSGDYALVGAFADDDNGPNSGSVYAFKRNKDEWELEEKLLVDDGDAYDNFGSSVSLSGNYAIVGAKGDSENGPFAGAAYILKKSENGWIKAQKLLAEEGVPYGSFGISASISDDHAIVGAFISGHAYIFKNGKNGWEQSALLTADNSNFDEFGHSVSISGDYAIVGAAGDDLFGTSSGAAYIFERNENGDWEERQKITASDSMPNLYFGTTVFIAGDSAVVGATSINSSTPGAAYVFERSQDGWVEVKKLLASDGESGDVFGDTVSITNDYVIVGARQDNDNGTHSGSAYFYEEIRQR